MRVYRIRLNRWFRYYIPPGAATRNASLGEPSSKIPSTLLEQKAFTFQLPQLKALKSQWIHFEEPEEGLSSTLAPQPGKFVFPKWLDFAWSCRRISINYIYHLIRCHWLLPLRDPREGKWWIKLGQSLKERIGNNYRPRIGFRKLFFLSPA